MLGWIHEKMVIQESAPGGGKFSAFGLIIVRNDNSACSNPCTPGGDYSINQLGGWASPLLGFPHTMLSVKRVKDNMRLTFIEKLLTNHKIKTNV
jgi:hypothetical protein